MIPEDEHLIVKQRLTNWKKFLSEIYLILK